MSTEPRTHQPAFGAALREPFDILGDLPTGTTLLEASAGTGKTWTIGALVARFVAEGHARLDEMLVVTFGRVASQELRQRVREQLVELDEALRRTLDGRPGDPTEDLPPSGNAVVDLLCTADRTELQARRRRVTDALAHFDGATIATIHQFCQQVLRGLGVAGDTDPQARLVEDVDDLRDEVVDDLYLQRFIDEDRPAFTIAEARNIARAAVNDAQSVLVPSDSDTDPLAGLRVRFAARVRSELDRRKQRAGLLGYDDLLGQLARALQEEDAPARIRMRDRWKVVLVDEFQDTDPVQWQVFQRAFHTHATMVLIGDPKQAIYGFRGGDVITYLEAAATADAQQTLATNWRSDAGLVNATARILEGAALGDPEIVVHHVEAHHARARLVGAPHDAPLRLRVVERSTVSPAAGPNEKLKMAVVRPWLETDCATDIAALIASGAQWDGRRLQAGDIAVLAHQRKQLAAIQGALHKVGVRSVLGGGGSVFATRAAGDWLTLLEALAAPHRAGPVRAAALTPFLGESVVSLDVDSDRATERAADTLRAWNELLGRRGIAAVLEAATRSGLVARVLGSVDGERHLTDLRHIGEALHLAGRGGSRGEARGLVGLIAWLRAEMDADDRDGVNERTRRLDSDASAVQLATIHGSKGLQYPVVYLPWVGDRHVSGQPDLPRFHLGADDSGHRPRALDVGGSTGEWWKDSQAAHLAEEAGESLRLLYVAMTRAQSQVVTWWAPTSNTPASALHRVLFGRTDGGAVPDSVAVPKDDDAVRHLRTFASPDLAVEPAAHAGVATVGAANVAQRLSVRTFHRGVDTQWRRTSYSSLSAGGSDDHRAATSEPEVEVRDDEELPDAVVTSAGGDAEEAASDLVSPMNSLPVGATFGSLVHAVLEHVDLAAAPTPEVLRAELAALVAEQRRWWPVAGLEEDVLVDALIEVAHSPLGDLTGGRTLRDIARADTLRELDFELPMASGDAAGAQDGATLGDLAPLLRAHLPQGDPVRGYADALDADPRLARQRLRGYLGGSVDVVVRLRGDGERERYLVVDYKTNWLGPHTEGTVLRASAYRPAALDDAMRGSDYPLQALLYSVVAHRFLRWRLADYDPEQHLGGVLYLYLRGMCGPETPQLDGGPCGVFAWRPPTALVEAVSDLLDGGLGVAP